MLVVLAGSDHFLGNHVAGILESLEFRKIRTVKIDRILKELKQPGRIVILDMAWKELEKPGLLKQLINIGRISGNKVICICPNEDEKLKKAAKNARPAEVFIRYDLELGFREYLEELLLEEEE